MADTTPVALASVQGLCPQCGARTLFGSITGFAPRCRGCGLDFSQFNVGDGPAAFLILVIGALITAMAVVTEVKVHPPFWVHILLWLPLTLVAVVGSLRVAKAALLILEYRNKAREGALAKPATRP
ncbi:DUF983 domain-containing protein [soil metagenome]